MLNRIDAMPVHDSKQSSVINLTEGMVSCNKVDHFSSIVNWSSLVIEPNEAEKGLPDEKGIPDEKPVDKNAMFALLGLKSEVDERGIKLGPIVVPTTAYDLHDTKGRIFLLMIRLQRSHLLAGMNATQKWI
jgi:hypothetical protein